MQQFWLTHPVEVTAGVPMDEDSLREMDEYLVQAQHEMGAPVEWAVSQEITHAQRDVMEEHRDPPTKVMDEAITSMVLAVKNKKVSYTTLLLRRIPLHESPALCWVLCPSERNNHGMAERLSSADEMARFLKEVRTTDFAGFVSAATVKLFARQADAVKFAATNCKSKKEVRDTNVVGKEWFQDMYAISGPPRGWETMPFSWKEMWLSKWGHNLAIHQSTHPWNKAWRESLLNTEPAASPRKKAAAQVPALKAAKNAGGGDDRKGKARGATIPNSNCASRHAANIAMEQPCEADTCDIFPCLNSMTMIENTTPKEASWLKEDGLARALNRDACLGLYASGDVAPHTWIASFGPLLWSKKGDGSMVDNGHVGQNGYRMYFCNALTPLGYKAAWGTPQRGWQGKHHAPLINHTCCKVHCNTRYVADEEATTFNVITTQHVTDGAEFLANYVHGFARPHSACFENLFSQKCKCCACTQRTVLCAPWPIVQGPLCKG